MQFFKKYLTTSERTEQICQFPYEKTWLLKSFTRSKSSFDSSDFSIKIGSNEASMIGAPSNGKSSITLIPVEL